MASQTAAPSIPSVTPSARAPTLTDDFRGTAGIVTKQRPGAYPSLLKEVRAARHRHYDRVVFEFSNRVPAYHIEYIDRPVRRCGSGDTTAIRGDGWLEIRLDATDAHTPEGRPTIAERERTLELGVLRELEQTCDFEAVVTWVLGLASPNRYRVTELSDPPRLVVDVHH